MKRKILLGVLAVAVLTTAQTKPGAVLKLTASTENVSTKDSIRIEVLRWSTDAEKDALVAAWMKASAAPAEPGADKQGKQAAEGKQAAAGKEAKEGKAAGKAAPAPPPPPRVTPEKALTDALEKAPTVGYLWSSEIAGYALHYAAQQMETDGSTTIKLITERRLGEWNDAWKLVGPAAGTAASSPAYEFSLVELHLSAKGEGEGKASLTGKVVVDGAAKTINLENYSGLPVIFKNVKRRAS